MKQRVLFLSISGALIVGVVVLASGAAGAAGKGMYRLVGLFGQVVQLVRTNYVEDVPVSTLELGALSGLVEAADSGGSFVPDDAASDYARATGRAIPPFGLVLGKRASYPTVLEVIEGSPAARAGILPGELIERIGSEPVRARPLWRALVLLDAGERKGGAVDLDVIDRQATGKRRVTLTAGAVTVPPPAVALRSEVPVARLASVDPAAAKQLAGALAGYATAPALILDLRGVALGSASGAAEVAAALAGGDVRVRLGGRDGKTDDLRATGPSRAWRVVVCQDSTTAGAAELLAAALKSRGATLIGGESYGDTGQRRAHPGAGGAVWLAASWGLGPDEKPLLGSGLKPDEAVRGGRAGDAVLDRALELAAGGHAEKKAA